MFVHFWVKYSCYSVLRVTQTYDSLWFCSVVPGLTEYNMIATIWVKNKKQNKTESKFYSKALDKSPKESTQKAMAVTFIL